MGSFLAQMEELTHELLHYLYGKGIGKTTRLSSNLHGFIVLLDQGNLGSQGIRVRSMGINNQVCVRVERDRLCDRCQEVCMHNDTGCSAFYTRISVFSLFLS